MSTKHRQWLLLFYQVASCNLVSIAAANGSPGWIETGKHPRYPSSIFIVGVGTASEQSDAEANALASIAKQIQADVQTQSKSSVSLAGDALDSLFTKSVAVDSSQNIRGAKFVERFKGPDNVWNILAVAKIADLLAARQQDALDCFQGANKAQPRAVQKDQPPSASEIFRVFVHLHKARIECSRKYSEFRRIESLSKSSATLAYNQPPDTLTELEATLSTSYSKYHGQVQNLSFKSLCSGKVQSSHNTVPREADFQAGFCENVEKFFIGFGLKKATEQASFEVKVVHFARDKSAPTSILSFVHAQVAMEVFDTTSQSAFFKTTADTEAGGATLASALAKADAKLAEILTDSFLVAL